ncbi:hypothetical protein J3A83DRAFT_4366781 [Scleroderma citrinum]
MRRGSPAPETLSLRTSGPSGPPLEWIIDLIVVDWSEGINSPILLGNLLELDLLTLDSDDEDYADLVTQLTGPTAVIAPPSSDQPRSLLRSLVSLKVAGSCSDDGVDLLCRELVNLKSLNLSLTYLPRSFIQALFET